MESEVCFMSINGPFDAGEDVISKLKEKYAGTAFSYIQKVGISSYEKHTCNINGIEFELGQTGVLEFGDVEITSLSFNQNEPFLTTVECIVVI